MMQPLPEAREGFPIRVTDYDRSIYTDALTGARYVLLKDDLWFLKVDVVEFLRPCPVPQVIRDDDPNYLPLAFIPGQGCRMALVAAVNIGDLFIRASGHADLAGDDDRFDRLERLSQQWARHTDVLRQQRGLPVRYPKYWRADTIDARDLDWTVVL
jgi:hypothetical protein